ncbi:MAG: hypothetical protein M1816_005588 [Peltula sp. TS41687]|nr:MAG: hypothetical protein M1816_005588 [Peltula sp. TS41687]
MPIIDPSIEISDCLRSLAFAAANPRQEDNNIRHSQRNTGEWIFDNPNYLDWTTNKTSDVLWLIGKAGSGKSTLLWKILARSVRQRNHRHLQHMMINSDEAESPSQVDENQHARSNHESRGEENIVSESKITASYFYNFRRDAEVDHGRMLQSILFQILKQDTRLYPLFRKTYLRLTGDGRVSNLTAWPSEDLMSIFQGIIKFEKFPLRIELFLDAIDEARESWRIIEILRHHLNVINNSDTTIKVIVASRPMDEYNNIPSTRRIVIEDHNDVDINQIIDTGIESIQNCMKTFKDQKIFVLYNVNDFKAKLKARANRVILWVSLVLKIVQEDLKDNRLTPADMMRALDRLPPTLEELYEDLVNRLKKCASDLEQTRHSLHWAAFAGRALSVGEFFPAIALSKLLYAAKMNHEMLENESIPHSSIDKVRITLASTCGGFLEVQALHESTASQNATKDLEVFQIQLLHRSVQSFLQSPKASPFQGDREACHGLITEVCIRYLKMALNWKKINPRIQASDRVKGSCVTKWDAQDYTVFAKYLGKLPLLPYIWTELPAHLKGLCPDHLTRNLKNLRAIQQELRDICLDHPGLYMLRTWLLQLLKEKSSHQELLEQWELRSSRDLLIETRSSMTLQDFLQHILVAAVQANCISAVRTICLAGALSYDEGDRILSAVVEAATKSMTWPILEYIGSFERRDNLRDSVTLERALSLALETACKEGYYSATQWLLKRGSILDHKDGHGRTGLHLAAAHGHVSVVQSLLTQGASIDCKDIQSRTPLSLAAEEGHEAVVRLLLEYNADPKIEDKSHRKPLTFAIQNKHEAAIKLLYLATFDDPPLLNPKLDRNFIVSHGRDQHFVGRADTLDSLEMMLKSGKTRMALVGLGGIGKTVLAVEFAYHVFERQIAASVFWIDADSDEKFIRSHDYIRSRLQSISEREDSAEEQLKKFYDWLDAQHGINLVIWDNVDFPGDLIHKLCRFVSRLENVRILVTTRNATVAQDFTGVEGGLLKLSSLPTADSVALMQSLIGRGGESGAHDEILQPLVKQLDGLPLALSQAASYIRRNRISPLQYIHTYNLAGWRPLDLLRQDGPVTFSDIVSMNLDRLEDEDPLAMKVLSFMSTLDANAIPLYLLCNESLELIAQKPREILNGPIAALQRYSLVRLDKGEEYLDIHRLLHTFVRQKLDSRAELDHWQIAALKAISDIFPESHEMKWQKCAELLPHATIVLEYDVVKEEEYLFYRCKLLRNGGSYMTARGRYEVAERLLQTAYLASIKRWGLDKPETLSSAELLAQLYLRMGRPKEAEELAAESMKALARISAHRSSSMLTSMSTLASALQSQGKYREAEVMERRALHEREEVLEQEHPNTLASMHNLALVFWDQGRWKEAEELEMKVLEMRSRVLGAEHPDTLNSMSNLAVTYSEQGRWKEAEELQVKVLEQMKKVLGAEHPDTLGSMSDLASTYSKQGRWKEAEELQVQVLEARKRVLGAEHPDTLRNMRSLAVTYSNQGRWKKSVELQVEVLEKMKKVLGAEHPNTLRSMSDLASTYSSQGRWKEAEELQAQALEATTMMLGAEHPNTLTNLRNLAVTYSNQGRWKEAEELQEQVLGKMKRVLGAEHPHTLSNMSNLASTYAGQGRWEEATALMTNAVRLSRISVGPRHPDTLARQQRLVEWQGKR